MTTSVAGRQEPGIPSTQPSLLPVSVRTFPSSPSIGYVPVVDPVAPLPENCDE